MKSDSGELARWMDGWMATEGNREAASPLHMPQHPQPPGPA